MGERSALRRRLALVREVDAIITIAGRRHTEIVLEEALETNTPVLPLAFARGDSKRFWKANKKQIVQWFSLAENELPAWSNSISRIFPSTSTSPLTSS